ncbi:FAD-binding oxidoreductase [Eubacteriaceae bacterium ES2]|nr:FAD-binding oxidoreductase [Eubacteriaceae bacterium ES2]
MYIKELKPLLEKIVGAENVSDDPISLVVYSRDYSSLPPEKANIIVLPGCTEEVAEIMRLATRTDTPVNVRGGATTAALCTAKEGIILDLNRMNKITKIDEDACLYLTAQGGTSIYQISKELDKRGFLLAGRPMFGPVASIGAWVNTVGIGGNCARYGYFSESVTGIEVVLPSGEIVRTGVNGLQNCDPYCRYTHTSDLTGIFVGARGSMGVVTEVSCRIYPKPESNGFITLAYDHDNFDGLLKAVNLIFRDDIPDTIDINDDGVGKIIGMDLPLPHMISMTIAGHPDEVARKVERCQEICAETGGLDLGPEVAELIYYGGALTAYIYKKEGYGHLVFIDSYWHSLEAYPHLYKTFKEILAKYGLHENCIFGWFMKGVGCSFPVVAYKEPEQRDAMNQAWEEICEAWFSVPNSAPGMSVTSPTTWNLDPLKPTHHALLRSIKDTIDPNNIMNPKVIPYTRRNK